MTLTDCLLRLLPWLIAAPVSVTLVWKAARHPRTPEGIERAVWLRMRQLFRHKRPLVPGPVSVRTVTPEMHPKPHDGGMQIGY